MIAELKKIHVTRDLPLQALEKLSEMAEKGQYYKNEIIFNSDDPADRLFVLSEGKVWIERQLAPPNLPINKQIFLVKKGQIFGEMGLLENTDRTATARAASQVTVYTLDYSALRDLFDQDPQLGYKFMNNLAAILGKRLRLMNKQWLNANARMEYLQELEYYG